MFNLRALVLSLVLFSLLHAEDALDVARWAPKDSFILMTWQGADAAAPAFRKSQLGQLWAEPQVQTFINTPLAGLMAALEENIEKENKEAREYLPLIKDILGRVWKNPGLICAFPAKPDGTKKEDWEEPESAALVWELGPEGAQLFEKLTAFVMKEDPKTRQEKVGPVSYLVAPDAPVYIGHVGNRWLMTLGRDAAHQLAELQEPGHPGFDRSPVHQQAMKACAGLQSFIYLNVQTSEIRERLWKMLSRLQARGDMDRIPAVREAPYIIAGVLGFSVLTGGQLGSKDFMAASGFDGDHMRDVGTASMDPDWPLTSDFVCASPLDPAKIGLIPPDVIDASLFTWDPSTAYRRTLLTTEKVSRALFATTRPASEAADHAEEARATSRPVLDGPPGWLERQITEELGLDLEQKILRYFGTHVIFYEAREFAGASLTLAIELKDAKGFAQELENWLKLLPPKVGFKSRDIQGSTLQIIDLSALGVTLPPLALSPCYSIAGDWLVLSSTTTGASRFLNLLGKGDAPSLAGREDVKKFLADHAKQKLTRINFSDESAGLQTIYPSIAMFYPLVTQGIKQQIESDAKGAAFEKGFAEGFGPQKEGASTSQPASAPAGKGLKIDFAPVPDFEVLNRHMMTTISYSYLDGSVRMKDSRSGASLSSPLLAVAGGAMGAAILLPSLARARELSKRTVCAANLKGLGVALHTYAAEHDGRYPETIRELVKSGAVSEKSLICPSSTETPGEGHSSYIYVGARVKADQAYRVIAYEKDNHGGEGGNVLFSDGTVEFVKPYSSIEGMASEGGKAPATQPAAPKRPRRARRQPGPRAEIEPGSSVLAPGG